MNELKFKQYVFHHFCTERIAPAIREHDEALADIMAAVTLDHPLPDGQLALVRARDLARDLSLARDLYRDLSLDLALALALMGIYIDAYQYAGGDLSCLLHHNINAAILEQLDGGGELDMSNYHTCETTHCRFGWAIHILDLYDLEKIVGPWTAGAMIYHYNTGAIPDAFASNEDALVDMRRAAALPY